MIILTVVSITNFYGDDMPTAQSTKKDAHLSVKLNLAEKLDLELIARNRSRSVHYVMCESVRDYIQKEKERIAFYDRGLEAIQHFDQTGLHTTMDEMKAWAKARKTNKSLAMPKCHI